MAYNKPIPEADEVSRPFFEGAKQHRLMIQKCRTCGNYLPPARQRCYICLNTDIEWVEASGKGKVYSYALMYQKYHPGFEPEIPYNIAIVQLEEGVKLPTNIVGVSNDAIRVEMPVEVTFDDITEEVSLPKFKPVD